MRSFFILCCSLDVRIRGLRAFTGSVEKRHVNQQVSAGSSIVLYVATGYAHTCAILTDYSVKCWGQCML
eukprot:4675216-Amphidinium_carterae.1